MAMADVDVHLVAAISLIGLVLGVVGSLYFAYDLLGGPGGPLRWLVQVIVPAIIGALIVGLVTWGLDAALSQPGASSAPAEAVRAHVFNFAGWGAALGAFNGLFVDNPDVKIEHRRWYFVVDALVAFVVVLGIDLLQAMLYFRTVDVPVTDAFTGFVLVDNLGIAAVGAVLGGLWRLVNRFRVASSHAVRLFSVRGAIIGAAAGIIFVLAVELGEFAFEGALFHDSQQFADLLLGTAFNACTAGLIGGGIVGGFTRYLYWRANSLESRGFQVIGSWLILIAFLCQALSPILTLLNVTMK